MSPVEGGRSGNESASRTAAAPGSQGLSAEVLVGQVAVVTGGESGIGLATARRLVEAGAAVVIIGLDAVRGNRAEAELNETRDGASARFIRADVRSESEVKDAFASIDELYGRLEILVSNAGANAVGLVDEVDEDTWDACMDTNLKGAFLAAREAIPRMREGGGGVIVHVASNAGLIARSGDPVYCASKAGLVMLTRAMSLGHARDRIRVNAVAPGPVGETLIMERSLSEAEDRDGAIERILSAAPLAAALRRMITPLEVADAILFLCRPESAMITGAILAVDGGKSAGLAN